MSKNETIKTESIREGKSPRGRRIFLNVVLSLVVIALGIVGAAYISKTAPKAQKRPPVKIRPLVKVMDVQSADQQVMVPAMGTVIAAREIVLESRVAGEIVSIHPEFSEGGFLKKGSEILQIDPLDYELALTLARARIVDAQSKLTQLKEEADAARDEWRELYKDREKDDAEPSALLLKQPQLAAARSMLAAEQADEKKAQLNLARTKIRLPFNAIVRKKFVDIGSQLSSQDKIAELVGTDEYWVRASLPVDRLDWIMIPRKPGDAGSKVRIFFRGGHEIAGTVTKLLGELETEGRMANVLVQIKDPLGLTAEKNGRAQLLIGEYLRMEIEGQQLQNVYRIPRSALRDSANIWILSGDGKLEIRRVETLWRSAQTVLLRDGIRPGEQLIVSDIPNPVHGMPLQADQ